MKKGGSGGQPSVGWGKEGGGGISESRSPLWEMEKGREKGRNERRGRETVRGEQGEREKTEEMEK